jgi:hypothetical protein
MVMYAVRGNKHLKITEADRATHLALGYDIAEVVDDKLKVVEVAPDKTVPYAKHKAALDRIAALEKQDFSSKLRDALAENEALKAELAKLKAELAKLKEDKGKEGGK